MKIGILTYHRSHNYGALLQAYALQTYLRKLGHQIEIIDYWPDYHAAEYQLIPHFKARSLKGKVKSILSLAIGYSRTIKRRKLYKQFIHEQFTIPHKPRYKCKEDMKEIAYDAVVYGSDQIWRRSDYPLFKGFSEVYFGAYPLKVKRKISYAPSMGVIDVKEEDKPNLRQMLSNFDAISVREEALKKLIDDVTGNQVPLVLDPVFLLEKEEWSQLSPHPITTNQEKYIFFYHLAASEEAISLTNRLEQHYGYKVIEIRGRVEPLLFGDRYLQAASPTDFISLIKNAEIVVSTSFHGVAFSLLFEKQFYALGMKNNSGRVQSLLDNVGIEHRLLSDTNQINFEDKIEYDKVNVKITTLKNQSKNYLNDALCANN
jgi:hypothetical protein